MSVCLDVFPLSFCSKVLSIYKKKSRGKNVTALVLCQERLLKTYYFVILTPMQLWFYLFVYLYTLVFIHLHFSGMLQEPQSSLAACSRSVLSLKGCGGFCSVMMCASLLDCFSLFTKKWALKKLIEFCNEKHEPTAPGEGFPLKSSSQEISQWFQKPLDLYFKAFHTEKSWKEQSPLLGDSPEWQRSVHEEHSVAVPWLPQRELQHFQNLPSQGTALECAQGLSEGEEVPYSREIWSASSAEPPQNSRMGWAGRDLKDPLKILQCPLLPWAGNLLWVYHGAVGIMSVLIWCLDCCSALFCGTESDATENSYL